MAPQGGWNHLHVRQAVSRYVFLKHQQVGGIRLKRHDATCFPNQTRSKKRIKADVGADIVEAAGKMQVPYDLFLDAGSGQSLRYRFPGRVQPLTINLVQAGGNSKPDPPSFRQDPVDEPTQQTTSPG